MIDIQDVESIQSHLTNAAEEMQMVISSMMPEDTRRIVLVNILAQLRGTQTMIENMPLG